ncbi:MAG: tetratricopeptide repeat protein [Bacteroidales bacterium]|nr:tetratricopeptide repeat protein [Bacteroidales bacterium]MBN2758795.1 tetratricopeptide repeat protein [Bacteroidales bacterium]
MEFLKRKTIAVVIILMFITTNMLSQVAVLQAFEKSYELEKKGEFKKAVQVLKNVYDANSYEINLRLGWLNYQAGIFNESVAHYQKAVNLMPYAEEAKFGLIYPNAAIGKWDEVISLYKKIIANSPNNTIANYRLGLIYYGQKEYQNAFKYFDKVVNLYPFGYDALLMLAWTNFQMGKSREAKVLFNKVLMYSPNDKSALEGLKLIK